MKKLTLAEFESYLDRRVADGFTAVHLHAFAKEQGPVANREGQGPFHRASQPMGAPDGLAADDFAEDLTQPNEAY